MKKAKKIRTYYDKYSNHVVYEYKGHEYEVEYSNCWTYCVTPAWIQHRDEQEKIDKAIEQELNEKDTEIIPFMEQLEEIYEMMGW